VRLKTLVLSAMLATTTFAVLTPAYAGVPAIRIVGIQYNSPGTDTGTNDSINAEYVVLKNVGTARGNLYGYSLSDAAGHKRTFGSMNLDPGQSVKIRSGKGTNSSLSIYWGWYWYIWNNTGDTAYLRGPAGTLRQTCKWTSLGTGYTSCSTATASTTTTSAPPTTTTTITGPTTTATTETP
jgi:Lamin Tail Domain